MGMLATLIRQLRSRSGRGSAKTLQQPLHSRLNVGCGRNILAGWTNLDSARLPGVDIVADLDDCAATPLPLPADSISEFLLSHVLEHLHRPLPLMQELWRVAQPGAVMTVRIPYGSSDDACEDPTHVRQYFLHSFGYFSQPFYWRADYSYRGDWQPERIDLLLHREGNEGLTSDQLFQRVMTLRNVVQEMRVELRCIKPARAPEAALRQSPSINMQLA